MSMPLRHSLLPELRTSVPEPRDLPGWLTGPVLRFVLAVLMAVLAWNITNTLGDIRSEMQAMGAKLDQLTVDYPRLDTRMQALEAKVMDNAARLREVERGDWHQPSNPTTTR